MVDNRLNGSILMLLKRKKDVVRAHVVEMNIWFPFGVHINFDKTITGAEPINFIDWEAAM